MGGQTIRQPDGKLAVWSTIVDDFIALDLTVGQVVALYREWNMGRAETNKKYNPNFDVQKFMEEADKGLVEMITTVQNGTPREGDWTWEEAVGIVRDLHRKTIRRDPK